jgi:hypothetical protein
MTEKSPVSLQIVLLKTLPTATVLIDITAGRDILQEDGVEIQTNHTYAAGLSLQAILMFALS